MNSTTPGLHTLSSVHIYPAPPPHLIVHVEALDVLAIALQCVDELVHAGVLAEQKLAVVDLVLCQHLEHRGAGAEGRFRDAGSRL